MSSNINSTIAFQKSLWWWWNNQNPLPIREISVNNTTVTTIHSTDSLNKRILSFHLTNNQIVLVLVFVTLVLLMLTLIFIYNHCYRKQNLVKKAKELEIVCHQNSRAHLTLYPLGGDESSTTINMNSSISSFATLCTAQVIRSPSRFQEHFWKDVSQKLIRGVTDNTYINGLDNGKNH